MNSSKSILIVFLIAFSFTSYSQVEVKVMNESKFGAMTAYVELHIPRGTTDTTSAAYLEFPNLTISLWGNIEKDKFLENLEACLPYMERETQSFSTGIFEVREGTTDLYIKTSDGLSNFLTKKNSIELRNWIKLIELP